MNGREVSSAGDATRKQSSMAAAATISLTVSSRVKKYLVASVWVNVTGRRVEFVVERAGQHSLGAQNIAEAHGIHPCSCACFCIAETEQGSFGDALGRSHDAAWIDGFVGRNHEQALHVEAGPPFSPIPRCRGRCCEPRRRDSIPSGEHVERRRVINRLWAIAFKNFGH